MTVVLVLAIFVLGVVVGAVITARTSHLLVGRLPKEERIAFARKVAAVAARDR